VPGAGVKVRITIIWTRVPGDRRSLPKRQTLREYRGLALPSLTRLTPQRRALLDLIAEHEGSFTAIELFQEARRRRPKLGLATVYRTVELLRRTGSVRPLAGDARPAYVRCEPGHHHHLICLVCGAVEETELCGAPSAGELRRRYGFHAEGHELDVYGTCGRCA
jgi:Fur family transcriptional regulator, ferric uptake regulator